MKVKEYVYMGHTVRVRTDLNGEYSINVPPEVMVKLKELYGVGFAGLTFTEFTLKVLDELIG